MSTPSHGGKFGMRAAGITALLAVAYVGGQLLEWLGWLGSQGGPNATSTPLGIWVLLVPSLLLGPAYIVTISALHSVASGPAKASSLSALGLAGCYATLTGFVYIIQLTFVGPRLSSANSAGIELLLFIPYKSFLFAVDLYGYALMCVSALFASFALPDGPAFKHARLFLFLTGLLAPALALQMFLPQLIWLGALWGFTFPAAMYFLCLGFAGLKTG